LNRGEDGYTAQTFLERVWDPRNKGKTEKPKEENKKRSKQNVHPLKPPGGQQKGKEKKGEWL